MNVNFKNFLAQLNKFVPNSLQKEKLDIIIKELSSQLIKTKSIVFVCTHNSRRSQLCEVWGKILSSIYMKKITINSAGTIQTDVNKEIYNAISKCGVDVNDKKEIIFNNSVIKLRSKTLKNINEKKFIAIMTCSDTENSCPNDYRSIKNINMFYEDPKVYDNTKKMSVEYLNTTTIIAKELNYIFKNIS